jgi:hypothetical protein
MLKNYTQTFVFVFLLYNLVISKHNFYQKVCFVTQIFLLDKKNG